MGVLAAYFVLSLITTAGQTILAFNNINNIWMSRIFSPIEFCLLTYVFYRWNRNVTMGRVMLFAIPAYLIACGLGYLISENVSTTFDYLDPMSAVVLVVLASYTLLTIDRVADMPVLRIPSFWVSSAAAIYFGCTIIFYSLRASLLRASLPTMQLAYSVQAVANIIANLLYAGGFLCLRQKTYNFSGQ